MKLKERTEQIDQLINSIDENNEGWRGDLEDIENDLEQLNYQKRRDSLPVVPGVHIRKMLLAWDQKNDATVRTEEQTDRFINELALSLR